MTFMVFPNLETIEGYAKLLADSGYKVNEKTYYGREFSVHVDGYVKKLRDAKQSISNGFGPGAYEEAERGLLAWQKAARDDKVGLGLWIARKP